jgi:Domain of Unknown Function (DUF1080)
MKTPILIAVACLSAWAADNTLTPAEKQAGFKLLFDGHTLNGWRNPASETPPGESWVIEDGCLKTTPKPRITEDLITKESYGDFELKFDWRISARGNTGVKYRIQRAIFLDNSKVDRKAGFEATLEREVTAPVSGRAKMAPNATGQEYTVSYEFQLIDDSGGMAGGDGGVHDVGALYAMIPPRTKASHPPGEWNDGRLVIKGDHFEHWINGVMVLDGSLNSDQAHAGTAKRWANAPTIRDMLIHAKPTGPLSLQHHGAAVWFKNLKIRPL